MDDSPIFTGLKLLSVGVLVAANAFFVAAEFALVAVRRSRIAALAESGKRSARTTLRLLDNLDAAISATQFGITLASLALGWIGEETLSHLFAAPLSLILPPGVAFVSAHAVAVAISFVVITVLHIVFGELAPKSIALARAERVALLVSAPLDLFCRAFKPFIWILDRAGAGAVKMFGVEIKGGHHSAYTEEEIRQLVSLSHQSGHLNADESELIHNVFHFTETVVREVMVPRPETVSIEVSSSADDVMRAFCESGYSRLPVYEGQPDNIVGFVHTKDILPYAVRKESFTLKTMLRKPVFIPDTAHLEEALRQLRAAQSPLAIVVDEHGNVEGIITMEDLLEQIVGEIRDEHDVTDEETMFWREADGTLLFDGSIAIREANRKFNLQLPESDDYATLGGFLMTLAGRLLAPGDAVAYQGLTFSVERVERRRVSRVRLRTEPTENERAESDMSRPASA
jgi:CBS domain containing-hemolysin-like protein